MNTPQQQNVPPEVWVSVTGELLKTPGCLWVKFVEIPIQQGVFDALGAPVAGSTMGKPEVQEFKPEDIGKKPLRIFQGHAVRMYEMAIVLPKPIIPAPGALTGYLAQFIRKQPMPIVMAWVQYNPETYEFQCASQGPPMMEMAQPKPIPKGILKPN